MIHTPESQAVQEEPGFLTKLEVAKRFRTSERQISRWMAEKGLPYLKLGNLTRFSWNDCEQWALGHQTKEATTEKKNDAGERPTHPTSNSSKIPTDQDQEATSDH